MMLQQDLKYWLTLLAGVVVAVAGQAELFPEPYRHYVTVAGLVATAVGGYKITPSGSAKL